MKLENKVLLITYPDSMGENLKDLNELLRTQLKNAVYGVHILPFFPSTADRGFAPTSYDKVEKAFGTWEDIEELAGRVPVTADFMINHISRFSDYYIDFQENKDNSPYKDMFIRYKDFWSAGEPTQEQIDRLFKRKPRAPYVEIDFKDGTKEKIWCTFSEDQIDLNFKAEVTRDYIRNTVKSLAGHGISVLRLDAFAYTTKYEGTNCFFVEPHIWDVLGYCRDILEEYKVELLPELHGHYAKRLELSQRGYYVYDYALPMLVLYSLYSGKSKRLADWIKICPRKQFTTLDTHDGIGVIDVQDLLSQEEVEYTTEQLYRVGANVKRIYNSEHYNNLDIYQINCTYYSALGDNDRAYLLARALQFYTPGIPQVYYVGLLCGKNDIDLLEVTKEGRNINRHYYSTESVKQEMERPVVKDLLTLMEFRNTSLSFNGEIEVADKNEKISIEWTNGPVQSRLEANLLTYEFCITEKANGQERIVLSR